MSIVPQFRDSDPSTLLTRLPAVSALAVGGYGSVMLSGSVGRVLSVWRDGDLRYKLNLSSGNDRIRPTERMRSVELSLDEESFFVSADDTVRAFETATGRPIWAFCPPRSFGFLIVSPYRLAASGDGRVAASFEDGSVAVWTESGLLLGHWRDNDAPRMFGFAEGGQEIVGTDGYCLCRWDAATFAKIERVRLADKAFGFAVHPQRPWVALRSLESVIVQDFGSGEMVGGFAAGEGLPLVAFRPGANVLAAAAKDAVEIVDLGSSSRDRVEVEAGHVTSMRWSSDGKLLCIGCSDGAIVQARFDEHDPSAV